LAPPQQRLHLRRDIGDNGGQVGGEHIGIRSDRIVKEGQLQKQVFA
jgi:hypothetical protein